MLVVDPQRRVEMANLAARRLLGVVPRVERQGHGGRLGPARAAAAAAGRRPPTARVSPRGLRQGDRAANPASETQSFLPRILPIRDAAGATLGAAVLLEDVTRFRLLDEVKSNLVATVSHELKTPLTSIRLVLHLLLEEGVGPLLPKQARIARRRPRQRRAAAGDDQQSARPGPAGAGADASFTCGAERPAAIVAGGGRRVPPAGRGPRRRVGRSRSRRRCEAVAADADQLQHALQNLLDNALAHTPQGGRITLAAEPGEGAVVFSVSDTGAAFPPNTCR